MCHCADSWVKTQPSDTKLTSPESPETGWAGVACGVFRIHSSQPCGCIVDTSSWACCNIKVTFDLNKADCTILWTHRHVFTSFITKQVETSANHNYTNNRHKHSIQVEQTVTQWSRETHRTTPVSQFQLCKHCLFSQLVRLLCQSGSPDTAPEPPAPPLPCRCVTNRTPPPYSCFLDSMEIKLLKSPAHIAPTLQ